MPWYTFTIVVSCILLSSTARGADPSLARANRFLAAQAGQKPGDKSGFGSSEFQPFYFIQAGDPQITGPQAAQNFIALGGYANRLHVAFVLACGDLLNVPQDSTQAALFDSACSTFHVPLVLVPGNHDMQSPMDLTYYRQHYGADYYNFTYNNCFFIIANSELLVHPAPYGDEPGQEWNWLDADSTTVSLQSNTHVFMAMHHPTFFHSQSEPTSYYNTTSPINWPTALRPHILNVARRAGCRTMFCGHVHETNIYGDSEFTTYTVGGTAFTFDRNHDLTAPDQAAIDREDRPTLTSNFGFRIIKVFEDRVEQQYVRIDQPNDIIAPTAPTALCAHRDDAKAWHLSWTCDADGSDTLWYHVYRDGVLIADTLEPRLAQILPFSASYTYEVTAEDVNGNISARSALLKIQTGASLAAVENWDLFK